MDFPNLLDILKDSSSAQRPEGSDVDEENDLMVWRDSNERILLSPYTYLAGHAGSDVRSKFINAFNLWLKVKDEDLEIIKKVVAMLHNGSLLMDDVEDSSLLRRGRPVSHLIYGVPQTINSANYVYFLAIEELFKLGNQRSNRNQWGELSMSTEPQSPRLEQRSTFDISEIIQLVTAEFLSLHRGQGLDMYWRDSLTVPTEKEWVEMVLGKTGGLFRISIKLMMAKSPLPLPRIDYVPLVNIIAVLFQMRDDYMNVQSSKYAEAKGFAEDLTEGKFSFVVVHAIRANPDDRRLINILQKRTSSHAVLEEAVRYMRDETGTFTYTKKVMNDLQRQAREEVKRLGGNKAVEAVLDWLLVKDEE